jgi:hypothetical protein
MVTAASGVTRATITINQLARPAALLPPALASTPRGDGGASLLKPDLRRIQLQLPRGARLRKALRQPRSRAAAPARLDAAPPMTDGQSGEPIPHMRLHSENPLETFGGEGACRHHVVGPRQRRRRGARVGRSSGKQELRGVQVFCLLPRIYS